MIDDEGMYGPLRNNLLFAVGYLLLGQIGLWYVRYLKGGYFEALVMGYTFLATAFGAKVYAEVNGLLVSDYFVMALFYFAFAPVLYYFLGRPKSPKSSTETRHIDHPVRACSRGKGLESPSLLLYP